jgi:hypothetical protein
MDALEIMMVDALKTVWLVSLIATLIITVVKGGRLIPWVVVGVLLGPFGTLLALFLASARCPHCKSRIHKKAAVCPHCQREMKSTSRPDQEDT